MSEGILIVDPQNDFFPGGALGVPDADQIIEPIQKLLNKKRVETGGRYPIFVTQDWHPKETRHFESGGGAWPAHCVQDTHGAEVHDAIQHALLGFQIHSDKLWVRAYHKGTNPNEDGGYSAFEAIGEGSHAGGVWRTEGGKPLKEDLDADNIDTIIVCGLATDYCIKHSVIDAVKHGFKVKLMKEGIKAVDINEGDGDKALQEMLGAGAEIVTLEEL